nr:hypothetical protein [Tanacetum cinerariifolium]
MPSKRDLRLIDEHFESVYVDVISNIAPSDVKTVKTIDDNHKGVFRTDEPKPVMKNNFSPPIIEDWHSDDKSDEEISPTVEVKTVKPSIEKIKYVKPARETDVRPMRNNSNRVNYKNFANKLTHPHPKIGFVPRAVLTWSGKINTAGASVNTAARPVNTAGSKSTVNHPRLKSKAYKREHSHDTRPNNKFLANKNSIFNKKVNTVKVNDSTARDRAIVNGNIRRESNSQQKEYKEKGVTDSGCSRHMTRNKRLGHINFKTMNKLVKGKLIRGLPLKIFQNDNSCVACQKRKQHKASYKAKLVNTISKPLHMLHMDLFGPRNVKSLMKKSYCLVVTDDFSRFSWFCEDKGIMREFSVARTPQQNRVAERRNRTLIEATRTVLADSKPPLIDFMKPFGCSVTIVNTRDNLSKFIGKADEGYFVGYLVMKVKFQIMVGRMIKSQEVKLKAYLNKSSFVNAASQTPINNARPFASTNAFEENSFKRFSPFKNAFSLPHVPIVTPIDDTGIFGNAYDNEVLEEEVDMNNVDLSYTIPEATRRIEEEVYVCQPPSFEDLNFLDKFYKVEKVLYGLHQAPRSWYETLSTYLLDNGFHKGQIDKTLFIKRHKDDILLVQVYVDDIIFGSTKKELSTKFEKLMRDKFQISSMGELSFFLGLQVKRKSDEEIFISQDKYVAEVLKQFDFVNVKTTSTLMESNKPLIKDEDTEDVDVQLYRSMIGSLMYLTASRPDITFVVCACARFQVNPKTLYLYAMKRIFRYLKGQPKLGLWYPKDSPFDLEAYSNSDYARASLDRKSTTGGCQFLSKRLMIAKDRRCFVDTFEVTPVNLTIYISCVKQFWATTKVKKVNDKEQIQALVDKMKVIITEDNIRSDLCFDDAEGTACLINEVIFEDKQVEGMARHKEMYIISSHTKKIFANMRRIGAGFSGPRRKQRKKAEVSHDELEDEDHIPKPSSDSLPSCEDSSILNKLMVFCTSLQEHVLDLKEAKAAQAKEIAALKKKRRMFWVIRRMIEEIDQNAKIALDDKTQGMTNDDEMFGVDDLAGEESTKPKVVIQEQEMSTTIPATATIVTNVVPTLRAKGIVFHKQKQLQIPIVSSSKDKGKAKMIEPKFFIKKKDQMRIDEEYARKLEAKEQEAARIRRAQQDEEANNS